MILREKTTEKEILSASLGVVVFLDLFNYPITAYEVWRYLDKKFDFTEIINNLEDMVSQNILAVKDGFYFLLGREEIIEIRQRRFNYACSKIKKARFFTKLFSWLPFIKAVAVANFIGDYNLRKESDIDFFIITSHSRLWLSRLMVTGLAKFLGLRPNKKNKKDKICLSFYISEDALELKNLELAEGDPYFYYWLRGLRLIYNKNNTWYNFLKANNLLLDKNLNKLDNLNQEESIKINSFFKNKKFDYLGFLLEKVAKKIQLKVMSKPLRLAMNNSSGVVVSDQILKLYLTDNRHFFAKKFNSKINEIFTTTN